MIGPKYGFDGPGFIRGFLSAGVVGALVGFVLVAGRGWGVAGGVLIGVSLVPLLLGLCMVGYSYFGKLRIRDFMISRIDWRGDERVLDIGAGRGLLLIGAAKRLGPKGQAVGIDIWRREDLTGNSLDALAANAAAEGVEGRVALLTEDARELSFPDGSFDVVFSLFCIHNIEDKVGQRKACFEIARVLKPGGRVMVGEFMPTHAYAEAFRDAGLSVSFSKTFFGIALGPMWMVEAGKAM